MAQPRPYGRGPYGRGPYERYRGAIYDCAAASSLAWSVKAEPERVRAYAGVSALAWSLVAVLGKTVDLGAARSALTFDTVALGLSMTIRPRAISEIRFDVDGDGIWSWDRTGVAHCWPGTWAATGGCSPADWTPWRPAGTGLWTPPGGVGTGVWTPLPPCGSGTWTETRP